jgi:hypothetical protein
MCGVTRYPPQNGGRGSTSTPAKRCSISV